MLRTKRLRCRVGVYQVDPNYMLTLVRVTVLDDLAREYDLAKGIQAN